MVYLLCTVCLFVCCCFFGFLKTIKISGLLQFIVTFKCQNISGFKNVCLHKKESKVCFQKIANATGKDLSNNTYFSS